MCFISNSLRKRTTNSNLTLQIQASPSGSYQSFITLALLGGDIIKTILASLAGALSANDSKIIKLAFGTFIFIFTFQTIIIIQNTRFTPVFSFASRVFFQKQTFLAVDSPQGCAVY